jgi:hypothetical protein
MDMDILRHLVFEDPTTLLVVFGIAAIIAVVAWQRNKSGRAMIAAVLFAVAAALVGILAWAVETDYEKVMRSVTTIANAAEAGNADALIERISPKYQNGPHGKQELAGVARQALVVIRAMPQSPVIQMGEGEATVTQEYRLAPAPGTRMALDAARRDVTWEGKFAPDDDGEWRLRSAIATQPQRICPEDAVKYLPKGR